MKKIISIVCTLLLVTTASAQIDLMQAFKEALQADPTLAQAKTKENWSDENVPINRAALLPSLVGQGNYNRQSETSLSGLSAQSESFNLNLKQTIFNANSWLTLKGADYGAKAAALTYAAAVQDLIVRTTTAYVAVVTAQKQLQLTLINRNNYDNLLHQNELRFKAGLVKTADVDNARAAYEGSLPTVVTAQNNLIKQQAALTAITNQAATALKSLQEPIPLIKPNPTKLIAWLDAVNKNNLVVRSDRYTLQADHAIVHANEANHLPNVAANVNYSNSNGNSISAPEGNSANANLQLQIPIFQGGLVVAQSHQAADQYGQDQAQLILDFRTKIADAKTNYAGVLNGIAAILADQAAIKAYQEAYKSTDIAYHAGLKNVNITTVLNTIQTLNQAKINYTNDENQYLIALVTLKEDAGTLNIQDLQNINRWLL